MLRSGVSCDGGETFSLNVIPTLAEAGFDCRISPNLATRDFRQMLDSWCACPLRRPLAVSRGVRPRPRRVDRRALGWRPTPLIQPPTPPGARPKASHGGYMAVT